LRFLLWAALRDGCWLVAALGCWQPCGGCWLVCGAGACFAVGSPTAAGWSRRVRAAARRSGHCRAWGSFLARCGPMPVDLFAALQSNLLDSATRTRLAQNLWGGRATALKGPRPIPSAESFFMAAASGSAFLQRKRLDIRRAPGGSRSAAC